MRIYRHLTANDVYLEPFPFKRELSMEAYLIDNEEVLALDDVFSNVEIIDAELSLKQGRKKKQTDGRIDILATYSQENIAIIEIKLGELAQAHLDQLEDYLLEKEQLLTEYPDLVDVESVPNPKWIGVLVGASIDSALAEKLRLGYEFNGIAVAALTIQRFRGSDGCVFVTTDTYFKRAKGRDTTQYLFEGRKFGKGRLALAIVKRYVDSNPLITFADLEKIFPKSLQGSSGVLATAEHANHIYSSERKRHFLDPEDLMPLKDVTAVVSSQWGAGNIKNILDCAKTLGYKVKPIQT